MGAHPGGMRQPLCLRSERDDVLRRAQQPESPSLLRVSPQVLDLPDVVVADGNAARQGMTRFRDAASDVSALDFERVHDEFWTRHGNEAENYEHKRVKQAEVLVPDGIDPRVIVGAYAPTETGARAVEAASPGRLPVVVAKYPFFRGLRERDHVSHPLRASVP